MNPSLVDSGNPRQTKVNFDVVFVGKTSAFVYFQLRVITVITLQDGGCHPYDRCKWSHGAPYIWPKIIQPLVFFFTPISRVGRAPTYN